MLQLIARLTPGFLRKSSRQSATVAEKSASKMGSHRYMLTSTIIGSGPNGLSAAIVLASAGINTTVLERNSRIGGACSTAETTLPGFQQDLGSSAYPMGFASPFFRSLPVSIPWIIPPAH